MKNLLRQPLLLTIGIVLWSLQGCSDKDAKISITGDSEVDALITSLYELDDFCQRGDNISCYKIINEVGRKINGLGWCARDVGQPTGTYTWHKCDADSFRYDTRYDNSISTREPLSKWKYRSEKDDMSDLLTSFATIETTNHITFDFPYEGPQKATLWLRNHPRVGKDAILSIEKGQFLCRIDECSVLIRFDDSKASIYSASEPSDGSTTDIFISNFPRFYSMLKNSKKLRIEAEFYQEGRRVLDFDVSGFDEARLVQPK